MKLGAYILDEHGEPVVCGDLAMWGMWMGTANRHLACDTIGETLISTVFLGLDHNWGNGPPVLWETMVFGGKLDQEQRRYNSRAAALAGHSEMVALVRLEEAMRDFALGAG